MSKPSELPRWGDTAEGDTDYNRHPTSGLQDVGWAKTGVRPGSQHLNWLLNLIYRWLEFLDGLLGNWTQLAKSQRVVYPARDGLEIGEPPAGDWLRDNLEKVHSASSAPGIYYLAMRLSNTGPQTGLDAGAEPIYAHGLKLRRVTFLLKQSVATNNAILCTVWAMDPDTGAASALGTISSGGVTTYQQRVWNIGSPPVDVGNKALWVTVEWGAGGAMTREFYGIVVEYEWPNISED